MPEKGVFILPDAALRHLKVTLGDSVDLNVIPHGFTLTKRETELD